MKFQNNLASVKFKRNEVTVFKNDAPEHTATYLMTPDDWRRFNKWFKLNKKRLMTKPKVKKIKVKAVKDLKLHKEGEKIPTDNSQPHNSNQH